MKKKILLIFTLAALLAFLAASCLKNPQPKEVSSENNQQEQVLQEEQLPIESEVTKPEDNKVSEEKETPCVVKKSVVKPTVKKNSTKITKHTSSETDVIDDENIVNVRLEKYENPKEIIVPWEFKRKSPAKYIFK